MELELDMCLMSWGPWMRAACTPGLVADGERRFVVEEVGPGGIWFGWLMAGYGDGFGTRVERKRSSTLRSRYGREERREGREGTTGDGCLRQKKSVERSKPSPRTRTGVRLSIPRG